MPWTERKKMDIKNEFIQKMIQKQQCVTSLCNEYEISRKTAYKWLKRYIDEGIFGLEDRSKRPHKVNKITEENTVTLITEIRNKFPAWGARKLRKYLINKGLEVPSERTFNRILNKQELISIEASEKSQRFIRFEREHPNELWQMDFKGHFQLEQGRCHPLTIIDDHSRFAICLKASYVETEVMVREALKESFRCYGLPEAMTMDNGSPWRGSYPWRFSKLTIWLMRLGIKVSHSRPGHPQTQGKDERFHRSLKEEVLKYYQFKNLKDTQEQFDIWRNIYNNERPHEGINLKCPVEKYKLSPRKYSEQLPEIVYEKEDLLRKVGNSGVIDFKGVKYFVGEHFHGEYVGVRQGSKDGCYDVYFSKTRLLTINVNN